MAVGRCEGVLGAGVPVLQSWSRTYRRHGLRASTRFSRMVFRQSIRQEATLGKECVVVDVQPSTRVSFFKAFGITPEEQISLESHYDEMRFDCEVQQILTQSEALAKPVFVFGVATLPLAGRVF